MGMWHRPMQIHKRTIISSYFSLCTVDTNKLFRSCILLNLIAILCILHVGCVNRNNDGSINIYPYPFAFIFPVTLLPGTFTLISAWISNYIHFKVWLEITYPFPHCHGMDKLFHLTLYWACDIEIDTNIEVIVGSLTTSEAHRSL